MAVRANSPALNQWRVVVSAVDLDQFMIFAPGGDLGFDLRAAFRGHSKSCGLQLGDAERDCRIAIVSDCPVEHLFDLGNRKARQLVSPCFCRSGQIRRRRFVDDPAQLARSDNHCPADVHVIFARPSARSLRASRNPVRCYLCLEWCHGLQSFPSLRSLERLGTNDAKPQSNPHIHARFLWRDL